jgi:hypothetical protein
MQVSILPPIAAIAVSAIAGPAADALLSRGVPVATVRKSAQCMAFLGPAACLMAASVVDNDPGNGVLLVGEHFLLATLCLPACLWCATGVASDDCRGSLGGPACFATGGGVSYGPEFGHVWCEASKQVTEKQLPTALHEVACLTMALASLLQG